MTKKKSEKSKIVIYINKRIFKSKWKFTHLNCFIHIIRININENFLYVHNVYNQS